MRFLLPLLFLAGCPRGDDCEPASGVICPWAGNGEAAFDGEGNHRLEASFYFPMDVEFSPYGRPVVADWNNHKLRLVEEDDTLTTIMGTDFLGDGPPDQSDSEPPGAPGTTVNLNHPTEHVYYPDGTLLSASWHTHKMRTWDPATGNVLVVAGSTPGYEDAEEAVDGHLNQPKSVVIDSDEVAWIVDMRNQRIRTLTRDGVLATVAGCGEKDFCGDGEEAIDACFSFPQSENPQPGGALAFSPDETVLYVADSENHRIRAIDLQTGLIETVAGTGDDGFGGDGGPAIDAQLSYPRDIEVSDDNRMYVADESNHRVRVIDLETWTIETFAGSGVSGDAGDGGPAVDAELNRPFGVEVDADGNVYIADTYNHRIRVVSP